MKVYKERFIKWVLSGHTVPHFSDVREAGIKVDRAGKQTDAKSGRRGGRGVITERENHRVLTYGAQGNVLVIFFGSVRFSALSSTGRSCQGVQKSVSKI